VRDDKAQQRWPAAIESVWGIEPTFTHAIIFLATVFILIGRFQSA
jgi:hypothetical protein